MKEHGAYIWVGQDIVFYQIFLIIIIYHFPRCLLPFIVISFPDKFILSTRPSHRGFSGNQNKNKSFELFFLTLLKIVFE